MKVRNAMIAALLGTGAFLALPAAAFADEQEDAKWRCTVDGNCAAPAPAKEGEDSAVGEGLTNVAARPVIDITRADNRTAPAAAAVKRPSNMARGNAMSANTKAASTVGRGSRANRATAAVAAGAGAQAFAAPTEVARKSDLFVTFRRNSSELDGGTTSDMRSLAKVLKESLAAGNKRVIEIGGHTDATGGDELNLALSQARAETVRQSLLELGVPADAIKAVGYGETKPIDGYAPTHGINRRVEVVVVN